MDSRTATTHAKQQSMSIDGQEDACCIKTSIGHSQFTAVEFPGYVRNADKALSTFGGPAAVANMGDNAFLKLSFRPEDPLAHPIFGDRQRSRSLLVRVSRPKVRPGSSPEAAAAAAEAPPTVKVVGTVGTIVRFNGLADFQYLPVDTACSTRNYSSTPAVNLPDKAEPSGVAEPLLCLPPLFSRSDEPYDYSYQQHVSKAARQQQQTEVPTISFFASAVPLLDPAIARHLCQQHDEQQQQQQQQQQPMETGILPDGLQDRPEAEKQQQQQQVLEVLRRVWEVLQQRPIWSAQLLRERVLLPHMQQALSQLCYKFKTGPWRDLLVRRSYDPRSDPASRAYQTVLYSVPAQWYARMADDMVRAAKQSKQALPVKQTPQQQEQGQSQQEQHQKQQSIAADPPSSMQAICRFEMLPTVRTVLLQLCDLEDEGLRRLLDQSAGQGDSSSSERCTEAYGWLTQASHAALQAAVADRFQQLIDQQQGPASSGHETSKLPSRRKKPPPPPPPPQQQLQQQQQPLRHQRAVQGGEGDDAGGGDAAAASLAALHISATPSLAAGSTDVGAHVEHFPVVQQGSAGRPALPQAHPHASPADTAAAAVAAANSTEGEGAGPHTRLPGHEHGPGHALLQELMARMESGADAGAMQEEYSILEDEGVQLQAGLSSTSLGAPGPAHLREQQATSPEAVELGDEEGEEEGEGEEAEEEGGEEGDDFGNESDEYAYLF